MLFTSSHNQNKETTNLKTKNKQNCQKSELYGNPTIKELKKKHSSRSVGGAESGGEDVQQGGSWWTGQSHICVWINREELLESKTDCATQDSSMGKIKLQNLWV